MLCIGILVMRCFVVDAAAPINSFCDLYTPVRISHKDTRGTKASNDINNRKYDAMCRAKGKRK